MNSLIEQLNEEYSNISHENEIITILNNEINKIHMKINDHHKRWISYIYSIKIQEEIDIIIEHNAIFDKRLSLLFQILTASN